MAKLMIFIVFLSSREPFLKPVAAVIIEITA